MFSFAPDALNSMTISLIAALFSQALLHAFDAIYHHEITQRLTWRDNCKQELRVHGARALLLTLLLLIVAWLPWQSAWALPTALGLLGLAFSVWSAALQKNTRSVSGSERLLRVLMVMMYMVISALLIMVSHQSVDSLERANAVFPQYGLWSFLLSALSLKLLFFGLRHLLRAHRTRFNHTIPEMHLNETHQRILLTGGTGFIGSRIVLMLLNDGHQLTLLTRNKAATVAHYGDQLTVIDNLMNHQQVYDVIINLAGEPIASSRWTEQKKRRIISSRVGTTNALIDFIEAQPHKPKLLLSGSAIGYYGTDLDRSFSEDSPPADKDFAHHICQQWEQSALRAEALGVRVVTVRIGIVLGLEGGALTQMLFPFDLGLGGSMGKGQHWMSWVHIDDLTAMMAHIINDDSITGAINGTAPTPVTNTAFAKALGYAMRRPALIPLPAFSLRLLFGEMAEALLLSGQKVMPTKALNKGFVFKYPTIETAFAQLFRR